MKIQAYRQQSAAHSSASSAIPLPPRSRLTPKATPIRRQDQRLQQQLPPHLPPHPA